MDRFIKDDHAIAVGVTILARFDGDPADIQDDVRMPLVFAPERPHGGDVGRLNAEIQLREFVAIADGAMED
mgnify:CR=1 FL=1